MSICTILCGLFDNHLSRRRCEEGEEVTPGGQKELACQNGPGVCADDKPPTIRISAGWRDVRRISSGRHVSDRDGVSRTWNILAQVRLVRSQWPLDSLGRLPNLRFELVQPILLLNCRAQSPASQRKGHRRR